MKIDVLSGVIDGLFNIGKEELMFVLFSSDDNVIDIFLFTIWISDENDSLPVKFMYVLGSKILFISISKLDLINNFWSVVYDKLPFIF